MFDEEKAYAILDGLLRERGLGPCSYRRGDKWRVHVSRYGNWWADNDNKLDAMIEAAQLWIDAGMPSVDNGS